MKNFKYSKYTKYINLLLVWAMIFMPFTPSVSMADDTCVFGNTDSEDVKPRVVVLLDNSLEMHHIAWHSAYTGYYGDNPGEKDDFMPTPDVERDFVDCGVGTGGPIGSTITVTSVTPVTGSEGETVTITGEGFDGTDVSVTFGGVAATNVAVNTDGTQITCTIPAGSGTVDVVVTVDGNGGTLAGGFTYEGSAVTPVVASLSPATGGQDGGNTVTITGQNFVSGATVKFGDNEATDVVVVSATEITCKTPPGTGSVDVTVTNPDAQAGTKTGAFSYVAPMNPPAITSVSPNNGPETGGTTVTITGTNFVVGTAVKFGDVAALNVQFVSETELTCVTPPGTGSVDVIVTNPDGQSATKSSAFLYTAVPPPTIVSVNPNQGVETGGTSVTITGTNFVIGATVKFGSNSATNVVVNSATEITCFTPAGTGIVNVVVTNPDGKSTTESVAFEYKAAPPTSKCYKIRIAKDAKFEVGETIIGLTSGTQGIITAYSEPTNQISEISVKVSGTGTFQVGEEIKEPSNSKKAITSIAEFTCASASAPSAFSVAGVYDSVMNFLCPPAFAVPGGGGTDPCGGESGNGFYNKLGYAIQKAGQTYYIVKVLEDAADGLRVDGTSNGLAETGKDANGKPYWTINGRTIKLPYERSTTGITDFAAYGLPDDTFPGIADAGNSTDAFFLYSADYLNWLFLDAYPYDDTTQGSDLPKVTRYFWAKYAIFTAAYYVNNRAYFAVQNFASTSNGANNVQPFKYNGDLVLNETGALDEIFDSAFVNTINNMGNVLYAPLGEGLASCGDYYYGNESKPNTDNVAPCGDNFVIIVSPGFSSEDLSIVGGRPSSFNDDDGDGTDVMDSDGDSLESGGTIEADGTFTVPLRYKGSTYLDDVAAYMYDHDMVGYWTGTQNVKTYTVGAMGSEASNAFLKRTSLNGNGLKDLTSTASLDPETQTYHFQADNPEDLGTQLINAFSAILSRTNTFTAPVVPVTRTTSGNKIYMAFFKPSASNFWEGNLVKFGLGSDADGNLVILDSEGTAATWPNGAMKDTAVPYWSIKDWAKDDVGEPPDNAINNADRQIYTYLGNSTLKTSGNEFKTTNDAVKTAVGSLTVGDRTYTQEEIINYVRGADIKDSDRDGSTTDNRSVITGDILHSEPAVGRYYGDDNAESGFVFYGSNDGMLHAVRDSDGTEAWAFIPPNVLGNLKLMLGDQGHQYYVDASPKIYISEDVKYNGYVDPGETAILVCGQRKGGRAYFAIDITDPEAPELKWTIDQNTYPELGETWSEPTFGKVAVGGEETKDDSGNCTNCEPVVFLGGGYDDPDTTAVEGRMVLVLNVEDGSEVKKFSGGNMTYSIPSAVFPVDINGGGVVDKMYVGDLGGQVWRFGSFSDGSGNALPFPDVNTDVETWTAEVLFNAGTGKKFFYPPTATLEKGFDLVFIGSGDRDDPCNATTSDSVYCFKDEQISMGTTPLTSSDLQDVTSDTGATVDLSDSDTGVDGWYINLPTGEKVQAEGIVYYGVYYFTTFFPVSDDPCVPGGIAKLYGVAYKSGNTVDALGFTGDDGRSTTLGGGIPSKIVVVITDEGSELLVSVGSTSADEGSGSSDAGVVTVDPLESKNFYELYWKELPPKTE